MDALVLAGGGDGGGIDALRRAAAAPVSAVARLHSDPLRSTLSTPEQAAGQRSARGSASEVPLPSARLAAAGEPLPLSPFTSPRQGAAAVALPSSPPRTRHSALPAGPRPDGPAWWAPPSWPTQFEAEQSPLKLPAFDVCEKYRPRYAASPAGTQDWYVPFRLP
eukprot:TRINITY_DN22933_c0_g1_i1.p1 TRINITY_DN22933_c0_g1~~TRINITY_DN22933_c0_g1_i1.p1  ORF type:complete len:182 (+),score=54.85 TRINITY_DN22933_c0_g1_i1:55-546(+)